MAGCEGSDHSGNSSGQSNVPPAPQASAYTVVTNNYVDHYGEGMGANPFDARYQFTNDNYPIGISYDNKSSDSSVNLPGYTKNSFYCWA
ncbi:MAG TPA: hypothetical protein VHV83_04210, partial [Armatimonadota bacterium]|nr:hypothetical protein [Armatimonadota bacterium]